MNLTTIFKNLVTEELKSVHVAFLAEILVVSGSKAKIQPLGLTRGYGNVARKQAPITNVPILDSAKYRITEKEIEYIEEFKLIVNRNTDGAITSVIPNSTKKTETIAQLTPIKKGDIVLCVCCDRNIDAALKGENSLPPVGSHVQSDCVIVSII